MLRSPIAWIAIALVALLATILVAAYHLVLHLTLTEASVASLLTLLAVALLLVLAGAASVSRQINEL